MARESLPWAAALQYQILPLDCILPHPKSSVSNRRRPYSIRRTRPVDYATRYSVFMHTLSRIYYRAVACTKISDKNDLPSTSSIPDGFRQGDLQEKTIFRFKRQRKAVTTPLELQMPVVTT
ncbi:hypothetical protein EVAR_4873_1 [Eumeta japonica]|uniref:Uncharacterized protein n=1 Tax=Eumeta variegata TaxID=151549 RepID=A0A4C1T073_EUMVA|nr:hypothetical protein EVAR_4873_1 [Eumeta japonica]